MFLAPGWGSVLLSRGGVVCVKCALIGRTHTNSWHFYSHSTGVNTFQMDNRKHMVKDKRTHSVSAELVCYSIV